MLLRIVKMHFREEATEQFREFFKGVYPKISTFPGCMHLEFWRDANNPCIFFTYSHWVDEEALEAYRNSELFKDTWAKTKVLFEKKAEAWSVGRIENNANGDAPISAGKL